MKKTKFKNGNILLIVKNTTYQLRKVDDYYRVDTCNACNDTDIYDTLKEVLEFVNSLINSNFD